MRNKALLQNARVGIAGLGGLGSNVAMLLTRAGVGTLHLLDYDSVEESNLNRQLYKPKHLGMLKTTALVAELSEINPNGKFIVDSLKITPENVSELFAADQIICEALDLPQEKAMLVNRLRELYRDKPLVAASGMAGSDSANLIVTKRIAPNFYLCGDGVSAIGAGVELWSARVSVCAAHQANMIIRLILGHTEA